MATATVTTISRLDYKAPDFTTTAVHLSFDIHDGHTAVRARLTVSRRTAGAAPLVLHRGKEAALQSVTIGGAALAEGPAGFTVDDKLVTIAAGALPAEGPFDVLLETRVEPEKNTSCEGLYKSGGTWSTQCEAVRALCAVGCLEGGGSPSTRPRARKAHARTHAYSRHAPHRPAFEHAGGLPPNHPRAGPAVSFFFSVLQLAVL